MLRLPIFIAMILTASNATAQSPLDELKKKYEAENKVQETQRVAVADQVHSKIMAINAVCLSVDGRGASLAFKNRGGRDFSAIYMSSGGDRWQFSGTYQSGRFAFGRSELIRDRPNTLYAESRWVIRFEVRDDGSTWMTLPERPGSSSYQEPERVDCGVSTEEPSPTTIVAVPADQAPISCGEGERRISHILIGFDGDPSSREAATLEKANRIAERLRAGESFSAIARSESDDIGSASSGGDLGCIKRGDTPVDFEEKAFGINVGEISDPVLTDSGYSIITVRWADD